MRHLEIAEGRSRQSRRHADRRRLHQARVEGAADAQAEPPSAPRTSAPAPSPCATASTLPPMTTCSGAFTLQICAPLAAHSFSRRRFVEAEHRDHAARVLFARRLHQTAALLHQQQPVLERKRAAGDRRRVLAQAVPGDEAGRLRQLAALLGRRQAGEADGHDCRLRVDGLAQQLFRPVEADIGEAAAQHRVRLLEQLARRRPTSRPARGPCRPAERPVRGRARQPYLSRVPPLAIASIRLHGEKEAASLYSLRRASSILIASRPRYVPQTGQA